MRCYSDLDEWTQVYLAVYTAPARPHFALGPSRTIVTNRVLFTDDDATSFVAADAEFGGDGAIGGFKVGAQVCLRSRWGATPRPLARTGRV